MYKIFIFDHIEFMQIQKRYANTEPTQTDRQGKKDKQLNEPTYNQRQ